TPHRVGMDGDYLIRTRVYAKTVGEEPVKIALMLDGKEVKQFEVKASEEKSAERLEVSVPIAPGDYRIAVALLNPFKDETGERTLFVEFLELNGPKDTRPAFQRNLESIGADKPKAEHTRAMLAHFADKAYRRPATKYDVERRARLAEGAEAKG